MFKTARLKLTAWYLLIIMVISLSFSFVIYRALTSEITRFERMHRVRVEEQFQGSAGLFFRVGDSPPAVIMIDPNLISDIKHRILILLGFINLSILIVSGGLGYFLAGKTLKPIGDMVDEQNRFVTDASHELKTPLTSLKSAFEVFLRNEKRTLKEADSIVKESIAEVNKLQSLSEGMLQLAVYENSYGSTFFESVELTYMVRQAIHQIEPIAKKKDIKLDNLTKTIKLSADKDKLINLLVILLDNAVKYSPAKTKVTVKSVRADGSIIITVNDHGMGINYADIPHLFDRFYRGDTARVNTDEKGFGLGLSIAKKIVEAHHGSIKVESKLKKGSTFIVKLPLKQKN